MYAGQIRWAVTGSDGLLVYPPPPRIQCKERVALFQGICTDKNSDEVMGWLLILAASCTPFRKRQVSQGGGCLPHTDLHTISIVDDVWHPILEAQARDLLHSAGKDREQGAQRGAAPWPHAAAGTHVRGSGSGGGGRGRRGYLSGARGAKQEVVERTQTMLPLPRRRSSSSKAATSVRTSSPPDDSQPPEQDTRATIHCHVASRPLGKHGTACHLPSRHCMPSPLKALHAISPPGTGSIAGSQGPPPPNHCWSRGKLRVKECQESEHIWAHPRAHHQLQPRSLHALHARLLVYPGPKHKAGTGTRSTDSNRACVPRFWQAKKEHPLRPISALGG